MAEVAIYVAAKDQASGAFRAAAQGVDSFGNSCAKANSRAMDFMKGMVGFEVLKRAAGGIKNLVSEFIDLSNVEEKALAGLRQSLISNKRYSEEFEKQLHQTAGAIQGMSTYGNEAVLEGQKFLATYKDISNDLMPRVSRTMADLAALMGGDMVSAANMLGKASMGMTGELRRVGITVDENTFKTKGFIGTLGQIEEQVGGQAAALRKTGYGGMKAYGNAMDDVKERIGDIIKLALGDIFERWAVSALNFADRLKEKMPEIVADVKDALTAFRDLWDVLTSAPQGVLEFFKNLREEEEKTAAATKSLKGEMTSATDWDKFVGFMAMWGKNILRVFSYMGKSVGAIFAVIAKDIATVFVGIYEALRPIGKLIVGLFTFDVSKIKEAWGEWKGIAVKTVDELSQNWNVYIKTVMGGYDKMIIGMESDFVPKVKEVAKEAAAGFVNHAASGAAEISAANRKMARDYEEEEQARLQTFVDIKDAMRQVEAAYTAWEYSERERRIENLREQNMKVHAALEDSMVLGTDTIKDHLAVWSMEFSSVAEDIAGTITSAFQQVSWGVGQSVADAIVDGQSLADALENVLKDVAKNVIASLISIGVQRLLLSLLNITLGFKEHISRMSQLSSQTYAAAFAATAAIPIIGPEIAPGVAAGAVAAMLGGSTAAAAAGAGVAAAQGVAHGGLGYVPREGSYILQRGEMVLAPEQNRELMEFLKRGGGGTTIVHHHHYNMRDVYAIDDDVFRKKVNRAVQQDIVGKEETRRVIQRYAR